MKNSLTLSQDEVQKKLENGDEYVIRLKVPRRETIKFEDEIRGIVSFDTAGLDDQVLLKSDGMPTYHLANVVDDHTMEITHVIRGEEWLSSAPKHMLLYKAFGWEAPTMAHLPLIMSPSGGKLSKRKAESEGIPVNTKEYRFGHYEPETLINFLAFLGWNPGDDSEVHDMTLYVRNLLWTELVKVEQSLTTKSSCGIMNTTSIIALLTTCCPKYKTYLDMLALKPMMALF